MPSDWLSQLENYEWAKLYANPSAALGLSIAAAHLPHAQQSAFLLSQKKRQEELKNAITRLQTKQPVVRAEHLIQAGIQPSKKMGQLLQEAEKISINQQIETPDTIIAILKNS